MDALTFIATITGHLAWPATVLAALWLAYKKAPRIAKYVRSIKYGDLEVTLRHEFEEARELAELIKAKLPPVPHYKGRFQVASSDLPKEPSLAIFEIWRRLESQLRTVIQRDGYMRWVSPRTLVAHLEKTGAISHEDRMLFDRLANIRNSVAHGFDITVSPVEVAEFKQFADLLLGRVQSIAEPLKGFELPLSADGPEGEP